MQAVKYGEDVKAEAQIKQIFAQAQADIVVDRSDAQNQIVVNRAKPEAKNAGSQ